MFMKIQLVAIKKIQVAAINIYPERFYSIKDSWKLMAIEL